MKKLVKIDNKEYLMQSSAYTQFAYKNETGRSFLQDLKVVINITDSNDNDDFSMEQLDTISELILKIAFIMIKEADEKQVVDYTSFVKSIESLYDDIDWIYEVIALACTPISRQLQNLK